MYINYFRFTALVICVVLFCITRPSVTLAENNLDKEARFVQKVKDEIAKLGTGPDARVDLKLHNKVKLKGYIGEIADESFVVVDEKTGSVTRVAYPQVKQVKGNNLSTGVTIAIAIGIVVALVVILGVSGSLAQ